MKDIFKWDAPLVQKLSLVTNLLILNFLWLICCIPVVTVGASTTALYYTVVLFLTEDNNEVIRPFFRSFRENFKQATFLWLPLLALLALLIFDVLYLFSNGGSALLWTTLILSLLILLALCTHMFPLLARFDMKTKALISTSISLTILHFPTTLLMISLELLPLLVFLFTPSFFLQWSLLWVCIWCSLVAYLNGKMLLRIWIKHMPKQETAKN